ncbi:MULTISPECIES: hypothetical protein [unclassified Nonomuraea]|uniref:hypothetical protein n=1 Tax=unclassified Nonomuraea TaxID=2593643 RepID=UPI00191BF2D3|nr:MULTISPECIES: hypothetical protein [unclassified Nonomuraea]
MMRVPVPVRLRKAVRTWFDSRYISIADHRQDIRDALWEVQTLRREMATLQGEVERLRNARPPAAAARTHSAGAGDRAGSADSRVGRVEVKADKAYGKADDAHRLAQETAKALDGVLQNEVLVWQAIDDLRTRLAGGEVPATSRTTAEAAERAGSGRVPPEAERTPGRAADELVQGRSGDERVRGRSEEQPCA